MKRILLIILLACCTAGGAHTQTVPASNADRLRAASEFLIGFEYGRAEALVRQVIADPRASRAELQQALAYLGIALWPADADTLDSPRRPATVDSAFRKLIELDPDATLPSEVVSWDGQKERLEEIRRRTLAGRLRFDGPQVAVGPLDSVLLRYRATRPARARLELAGPGLPTPVIVERTSLDTAGTLALRVNGAEQPLYATGEYTLTLTLRDRTDAGEYTRRYAVAIEAVGADYVTVNPPGDPPDLLPEVGRPRRTRTVVGALLLGGATVALASTIRADGNARDLASPNPQGLAVAGGLTLGGFIAAFKAAPRELPDNVRFNIERKDEWSLERDRQLAENLRRRGGIRTRFRVVEEVVE